MPHNTESVFNVRNAVTTTAIPGHGRKITYRGYLIHGEIPSISYVVYGWNKTGQLSELGVARSFPESMQWVDGHIEQLRRRQPILTDVARDADGDDVWLDAA